MKRILVILLPVAATLLTRCASQSKLLVTKAPLDLGGSLHAECLAIPSTGAGTVKYWDPGKDCSQRNSSVGESQAITEPRNGVRTVRFDIGLHKGVAHVAVRVTGDRIESLQTGAQQALQEQSTVPNSNVDKYLSSSRRQ